ncbi:hypothetical protein [Candidatus Nitrosocosmicus franklandus]|uniref:Uncharacterized protein n=1 Tax=Candidatus Nitrosocosmicus franklandianus TaxID=1798806 RepID=A0A484IDK7_9ARCH|nr:hypothetical protein [Candidatus Nitrosocosmicus franklandus]VFJ14827.1 conserved protein of unknown function [Candidatus Nitrosocosmicus franklandus]
MLVRRKKTINSLIIFGIGILLLSLTLQSPSVGFNSFQVMASSNTTGSNTLTDMGGNLSNFNSSNSNTSIDLESNNLLSNDNNTLTSFIPLNENQRQLQIDSKILEGLVSNKSLGNISSFDVDGVASCNTLDGTSSDFLGINEQTPCTVTLANNDKVVSIDFDYEVIENDDTYDYVEYYNNEQQPANIAIEPGEIFVFSSKGGIDYDRLGIYFVDGNTDNGNIIGIDSNDLARVFLDHIQFLNTDFFIVPNIDDGISSWKLVVGYDINPELESYYIAENVSIEG